MNADLDSIRRLIPLLDMAFQKEQMKMAKIAARIYDLREQLMGLERPESFGPLSVGTRMGADVLWETWVQDRKALITQEMALALQDRENQRGDLIAALSKVEAAKQVEKRARMQAKQLEIRRASW